MNWGAIKYIFQIPLEWYKKIHNRVFNSYGTNFLIVREGAYGGTEIGIDSDGFKEEVNRSVNGFVRSVNSVAPDGNGDVDLGDIVHSVNSVAPDGNGDVIVDTGVMTINNTAPTGGNIQLDYLSQNDWMNANSNYSVCPYAYANAGYVNGNLPDAVTNVYTYTGMMQYNDLDSYIYSLGYLKEDDLVDYVTTTDLETTLADYVTNTDLEDYVTEQDFPNNFFTSLGQVQSDVLNVVTDVIWTGTVLQKKTRQLTVSNGLITGIGNEITTTIDTPTVITWA